MVQKPMEERGENDRKHVVKKCWTKPIENPRRGCIGKYNETWGKHDNDQRKMLGTNHAKSVGTWRKPQWLLGTNYDDAVNMLEKDSESAGKCDSNQRKWCKNDRKMKETGKTLITTWKMLERYSRGKCDNNLAGKCDNNQNAKSVGTWRKPQWLLGTNYDDAVNMLEKDSESAGKCDSNQRKWCKNDRKMKETGKTLGKIHWKCSKPEEMVQKGDG